MSELLSVLETLVADAQAGRPVALCTIVRTRGSTPQAPGASMLVRADMSTLGTLGGGCVEADVRRQAFDLLQTGRSGLLDFLLDHDYGWDDGLICGGRMYVAVMPLAESRGTGTQARRHEGTGIGTKARRHEGTEAGDVAARAPRGRRAAEGPPRESTPVENRGHSDQARDENRGHSDQTRDEKVCHSDQSRDREGADTGEPPASDAPAAILAAYERALTLARQRQPAEVPIIVDCEGQQQRYSLRIEPPPTLIIAGAGHVGAALARIATDLDFHVVLIDDRADFTCPDRFPAGVECITGDIAATLRQYPIHDACYVVVVTRGHRHDHAALAAVIDRPARYIGMIGSRRKARMILKDLAAAGVPAEHIERVHTPIGLAIGAVTVSEIAISIAAELIQARRKESRPIVTGPVDTAKYRFG